MTSCIYSIYYRYYRFMFLQRGSWSWKQCVDKKNDALDVPWLLSFYAVSSCCLFVLYHVMTVMNGELYPPMKFSLYQCHVDA